jgi:hypothetical protein
MSSTKPIYVPLIKRADRVARKLNQKRSTLSAHLFNDGKKLDRLAGGGDVHHSVYVDVDGRLAEMERELGLVD